MNSNKKKAEQLGMPHGTAANRLRKMVLFKLLEEREQNLCFQCGEWIKCSDDLSIEHKIPWLDSDDPASLFFDLGNIAFSHLKCNAGSARRHIADHGTARRYGFHKCRCNECREAGVAKVRRYKQRRKYKDMLELEL